MFKKTKQKSQGLYILNKWKQIYSRLLELVEIIKALQKNIKCD